MVGTTVGSIELRKDSNMSTPNLEKFTSEKELRDITMSVLKMLQGELADSPVSFRHHVDFHHGRYYGYCCAKQWEPTLCSQHFEDFYPKSK